MMHKFGVIALALGLAAAPTAFADQGKEPVKKPMPKAVKMTDAQLDKVVAGDLIDASLNLNNVVHINNVARINKVDVF
jgi:hypothetical protein